MTHLKVAEKYPIYYTVSASLVGKNCTHEGASYTTINEWLTQRAIFYAIYDIGVFRNFKIWKSMQGWKNLLSSEKREKRFRAIEGLLFHTNDAFQSTILNVRGLCESFSTSYLSEECKGLFLHLDMTRTYTVDEFCSAQREQFSVVRSAVTKLRADIIRLIKKSCDTFYTKCKNEIEANMQELEQKHLQPLNPQKQKTFKSFQAIKDKYNIVEHSPPEIVQPVTASKRVKPFNNIRNVQMKAVHLRVRSFIRLMDFLVMDMLRSHVVESVCALQSHMVASSELHPLPQSSPAVAFTSSLHETVVEPLLQVSLLLHVDDSAAGEESQQTFDEPAGSSLTTMTCALHPTCEGIVQQLRQLLSDLKMLPHCFTTLLKEESLVRFVVIPQMSDLSEDVDNNLDNVVRRWPDVSLLFEGDNAAQQAVRSIIQRVEAGMAEAQVYVDGYEQCCVAVSHLNVGDISVASLHSWDNEQFNNVLKKYTKQICAIEHIPDVQRKGLFLVANQRFKSSCLPFLTEVVSVVNHHLPIMANTRNDGLLKNIKKGERVLSAPLKTIEELVEHLSSLSRLAADIPNLSLEFEIVSKMFTTAFKYGMKFSAEETALYQTLKPSFNQLVHLITACEARKDTNISKFAKELDSLLESLSNRLKTLSHSIQNPALLDVEGVQSSVLETIQYFQEDLEQLRSSARMFSLYEECFNGASSKKRNNNAYNIMYAQDKQPSKLAAIKTEISELEQNLMLRKLAWQSSDEWDDQYASWLGSPFSTLDVLKMQKDVSKYIQTVHHLEKGLPSNTLVPHLKEKVTAFKLSMPVISCLRNPSLKARHWTAINTLTGEIALRDKGDKRFTLRELLQLNIFKFKDDISEVSTQATNEATLEEMLKKVVDHWKETDLHLVAHHHRDVAIITKVIKFVDWCSNFLL